MKVKMTVYTHKIMMLLYNHMKHGNRLQSSYVSDESHCFSRKEPHKELQTYVYMQKDIQNIYACTM